MRRIIRLVMAIGVSSSIFLMGGVARGQVVDPDQTTCTVQGTVTLDGPPTKRGVSNSPRDGVFTVNSTTMTCSSGGGDDDGTYLVTAAGTTGDNETFDGLPLGHQGTLPGDTTPGSTNPDGETCAQGSGGGTLTGASAGPEGTMVGGNDEGGAPNDFEFVRVGAVAYVEGNFNGGADGAAYPSLVPRPAVHHSADLLYLSARADKVRTSNRQLRTIRSQQPTTL